MAKKKKEKVYASDGLEFDPGEIPKCDYCNKPATDVDLFETVISGGVCCDRDECRLKLAEDCCDSQIELKDDDD